MFKKYLYLVLIVTYWVHVVQSNTSFEEDSADEFHTKADKDTRNTSFGDFSGGVEIREETEDEKRVNETIVILDEPMDDFSGFQPELAEAEIQAEEEAESEEKSIVDVVEQSEADIESASEILDGGIAEVPKKQTLKIKQVGETQHIGKKEVPEKILEIETANNKDDTDVADQDVASDSVKDQEAIIESENQNFPESGTQGIQFFLLFFEIICATGRLEILSFVYYFFYFC